MDIVKINAVTEEDVQARCIALCKIDEGVHFHCRFGCKVGFVSCRKGKEQEEPSTSPLFEVLSTFFID